jgi:hypothetical protein
MFPIGSFHAADPFRERFRQFRRHAAAKPDVRFSFIEGNTIGGAAGAASMAWIFLQRI